MLPTSTVIWQSVITALVAIVIAYIKYQSKSIHKIMRVAEATHTLVNSNMGIQLKINMVATRRLALLTNEKDDLEAANLAERLYIEHQTKQSVVDASTTLREVPLQQPDI